MVKAPVKVLIRARPTEKFASKNINIDEEKGSILITIPKNESMGYVNHQQEHWQFQFDKILLNTSQEFVFDITCKDILRSALDGFSGTVIAYGQTGAGKTFTISGTSSDYKYRGIIPRSVELACAQRAPCVHSLL